MDSLSTEAKIGQLFLARCLEEDALSAISQYRLGGYILFARDFTDKTPTEVKSTIAAYQQAASIPMLIVVDEEGGTVCRISSNPQFRTARFSYLRKTMGFEGVYYHR